MINKSNISIYINVVIAFQTLKAENRQQAAIIAEFGVGTKNISKTFARLKIRVRPLNH